MNRFITQANELMALKRGTKLILALFRMVLDMASILDQESEEMHNLHSKTIRLEERIRDLANQAQSVDWLKSRINELESALDVRRHQVGELQAELRNLRFKGMTQAEIEADQAARVLAMIEAGSSPIAAIKMVREESGLGLKQAKDIVDSILAESRLKKLDAEAQVEAQAETVLLANAHALSNSVAEPVEVAHSFIED